MPLIPGVPVTLGGRELVVPPFSFAAVKRLDKDGVLPRAFGAGEATDEARYEAVLRLIHTALSRNYAELTVEGIEELLDRENTAAALDAVMVVNRFKKAEDAKPGEP